MDFDIEIIVRLHRAGVPIVNHPVRVTYLPGNLSNFRLWRDNWRITQDAHAPDGRHACFGCSRHPVAAVAAARH